MNRRQRMALGVPPLLLRVALAVTFIWAGLGKVMMKMPVSGERAAVLANMGVSVPDAPVLPTPSALAPNLGVGAPPSGGGEAMPADAFRAGPRSLVPGSPAKAAPAPVQPAAEPPKPRYHASDFPNEVEVRRVYAVALRIHAAAFPPRDADGDDPPATWPARLAQDSAPRWLAWAVVLAELGGGIALLLGVLTRFAALGIVGVMAGAMWLDQIGPVVQAGQTVLGFLPDRPAFDVEAWRPLLWQFMLFMGGLAIVFAGPGMLALDNLVFNRRRGGDEDDED